MFKNQKNWLKYISIFCLFTLISGISYATLSNVDLGKGEPLKKNTYIFKYIGTPGNEHNRTLWEHITGDYPTCPGQNDGCLIEVDEEFVEVDESGTTLTEDVPVTSGAHKNPIIDGVMIKNAAYKNP